MAPSFSSPSDDDGTPHGKPPPAYASGVDANHDGENLRMSGIETTKNSMKLRVAIPFTTDDKVNPIPMISKVLETALMIDPTSCLKAPASTSSPISAINEIPTDEKIYEYAVDLQSLASKKQFVFYIVLDTSASFNAIKFNKPLFSWLMQNRCFLGIHTMNTHHTNPLGFFFGVHPTLTSRDGLKEILDGYMHGIEYDLVPVQNFYYDSAGKKVKTKCVEIQVDSQRDNEARDIIASAFLDPTFLEEITARSADQSIDFVPYIKKGVITVETFRSALAQQHQFNTQTIGVSVLGIGGLEVEVPRNGKICTLLSMILGLKTSTGSSYFTSIEPTKRTSEQGRFILLTQKPIADEAEKQLDNLLETLDREGLLSVFAMDGHPIRRVNQIQSKLLVQYSQGLANKFKPMETVAIPSRKSFPTRNAWNRTPKFKISQENFPELSPPRQHSAKKPRSNETEADNDSHSQPSRGTLFTEMTDERTEFVNQVSASFTAKLNLIKKEQKEQQAKIDARLKQTEQALANSQKEILAEFENMSKNYGYASDAHARLNQTMQSHALVQDQRYVEIKNTQSTMMEILVNMNQSLALGQKPAALSPEQIQTIQQATAQVTYNTRNGAPGNLTESSMTTDPTEGGQSN